MNDRLQDLASAYLNGELSETETAELRALLRNDPQALREFVRSMDFHAELRKIHLERKGTREALKELRPRRRLLWISAAAAAVLVAGLALWLRTPAPGARLESLVGQVRGATLGEPIPAGREIETVGDSRATLVYEDGTRVELKARTLISDVAQARVLLTRGALTATVRPQPADRPMTFVTPQGEARVLGTTLRLSVEADATRLEVTEGKVRLTRGADSVEVAADHVAVASKTAILDSKPITELRAADLVRRMAPNSWLSIPGTRLRQACPDPARFAKLKDPRGIIESWSGGALDTRRNRLVVWGGGHVNYQGNELYAFDLDTLRWERLTDPTADPALGQQVNRDGTPMARATYNGLAYLAQADRLFALGGDLANSPGPAADITWSFDFGTRTWQNRQPGGDRPPSWVGCTSAYDPATRKVWWGESRTPANAGLFSYDVEANRWTKHAPDHFYYQTSAVDTRRGRLVCIGDGKLFSYDIRGGNPVRKNWATTGAEALIAKGNPGWDYVESSDRLVGWAGGAVQVLDPETRVWKSFDAPGAPAATANGIFGRWRYVPSLAVFVVVTGIDENVHFYKPPQGD